MNKEMMFSVFLGGELELGINTNLLQDELLFLLDFPDCFQASFLQRSKQTMSAKVRNKSTCESLWMAVMEKRSNHLSQLLPQYAVQLFQKKIIVR